MWLVDLCTLTTTLLLSLQSKRETFSRVPAETRHLAGRHHFRFLSVLWRGVRRADRGGVSKRGGDDEGMCQHVPGRTEGVLAITRMVALRDTTNRYTRKTHSATFISCIASACVRASVWMCVCVLVWDERNIASGLKNNKENNNVVSLCAYLYD